MSIYMQLLKEQVGRGRGLELGKGGYKKKPSPTFAYELVHGKAIPGGWRSGRCPLPHKTKIYCPSLRLLYLHKE